MKISKRTREQAALICAIAASEPKASLGGETLFGVAERLDAPEQTTRLAHDAKTFAWNVLVRLGWHQWVYEAACAEAESLLRCGWSPQPTPRKAGAMKRIAGPCGLEWIGSKCGIRSPHENTGDYPEGAEEDCVLCDLGDVRDPCIATVVQVGHERPAPRKARAR